MRQLGAHLPEAPPEPPHVARVGLEAVPPRDGAPWGLLDDEQSHGSRSSFLTIAVPAVAAVLALGALLWSGSLRDRVHRQDAVMTALQQQNQKLADTVEEMTVEQKAASALMSSRLGTTQHDLDARAADIARQQQQITAAQRDRQTQQQRPTPEPQQHAEQARQKTSEPTPAPQIVPPYPTNYSTKSAASAEAKNAPYTEPKSVPYTEPTSQSSVPAATQRAETAGASAVRPGSDATASAASGVVSPRPNLPSAASNARPPSTTAGSAPGASAQPGQYYAEGNAFYASPLAQNIEAVQGLQRHSTVPLQEFHVHEGMLTKLTPALGLSVRHPEENHGTYALVVYSGKENYQLKGQVNNPLVFTDNSTHREFELVVMRIANQQIYGYVRAMR